MAAAAGQGASGTTVDDFVAVQSTPEQSVSICFNKQSHKSLTLQVGVRCFSVFISRSSMFVDPSRRRWPSDSESHASCLIRTPSANRSTKTWRDGPFAHVPNRNLRRRNSSSWRSGLQPGDSFGNEIWSPDRQGGVSRFDARDSAGSASKQWREGFFYLNLSQLAFCPTPHPSRVWFP